MGMYGSQWENVDRVLFGLRFCQMRLVKALRLRTYARQSAW